jgi:drug/metabolite transporter (DMT)-like permease
VNPKKTGLIHIHAAVFLFGLSGLLGKLISLSPLLIVFGRTFFASIALACLLWVSKTSIKIKFARDLVVLMAIGMILALHWWSFFQSIKVSTVAIGLITFSTFPLFVTFMEPYFFRERLTLFNIVTALLVFIGLILVIPRFDLENNVTRGVIWGVISGFTFAVLSLLNRKYAASYQSTAIALFQNSVAALALLPFVLVADVEIQPWDYILVPFLGVFCTAAAHTLFIKSLTQIKAQLASVIAGLEPVYGIILAIIVLNEHPSLRTWIGGSIILGTILAASVGRKR